MTVRRSLSLFTASLLLAPMLASAASVSGIVDTKASTVSRANFLSWSFQALELPKSEGTCTLPYARFPRGLKSMLCAAQTQGALQLFGFGKEYPLAKTITRGEALEVITELTDKQEEADISTFKDVKTDIEKQAVMNAIALKWMVPTSTTSFGFKKPLTGAEALSLLQAVSGDLPERVQNIKISIGASSPSGNLPDEDLMIAVWQLIKRDYLHKDKIDDKEAAYKAIEGLVNSLGDPYSNFFRPANASNFQSQIKGELSGIGAQIEEKAGVIIIAAPLPGSPAERAGLKTGDEILMANGVKLTGIGSEEAVKHIRGERGTFVELQIRRNGVEMMVKVQRDTITIPEISVKWQGDIAVVQLVQFGETTEKKIRSIFADIAQKNPRGIVLDLRNNGGGLLNAADIVLSNFLPRNTVVAKVKGPTQTSEEKTQDEPIISATTKVAVLVNKGSASASEIVAGALQDLKRATIVGTTTFGKGTVQEVLGFRTGEALKLTIAEWLTPLGRQINGIGIEPDVKIDTDDRDAQLLKAMDILR